MHLEDGAFTCPDLSSGCRGQMGVLNPQKHPLAFERHLGPEGKSVFPTDLHPQ